MALTTVPVELASLDGAVTVNESSADADFRVESNGKTHALFIDGGNNQVLLNTSTARSTSGVTASTQIHGTGYNDASLTLVGDMGANALTAPVLFFAKTRGSAGGSTVVSDGDRLGAIFFNGADGTDINTVAASIDAVVDGTPGSDDMPGRLTFRTSSDGSGDNTERMRIDSSGNVGIGATPEAYGSGYKALDIGSHAGIMAGASGSAFYLNENSYWDGSNFKAKNTAAGSQYHQTNGEHRWNTMASVSADANQTVTRVMTVDASGHVTMPLQPAFSAQALGQSNLANGTQIHFDAETFDRNADYNNSTSVFAAPVDGTYFLSANLRLVSVTADASYIIIRLVTSNINYDWIIDPRPGDDTWDYLSPNINVVADLDASDTAYLYYYQSGGTFNNDIAADVGHFAGYLVG